MGRHGRGADARRRARHDPLQRRRARHRGPRHRAGRDPRCEGAGKRIIVIANETRPFLQGARLTAWEMVQEGIPVTLITDNMAGALMSAGRVERDRRRRGPHRRQRRRREQDRHLHGRGAGRSATTSRSTWPRRSSTFDPALSSGAGIPIEERAASEVTGYRGVRWAPEGVAVAQSGVRRHAGGTGDRADHRKRRRSNVPDADRRRRGSCACSAGDVHRRPRPDQVEEFDDLVVAHAHAADRARPAHRHGVGTAVDVDIAAHGVDVAQSVEARLAPAQPQDARQDPVALRERAPRAAATRSRRWAGAPRTPCSRLARPPILARITCSPRGVQ